MGILPALKSYRLYRYGLPQEAIVRGISVASDFATLLSWQRKYLVTYQYASRHGGSVLFGESGTDDLLLVNKKKLGDKVAILASPTNEKASCLLPRLEALKDNWQV